MKFKFSLEKVLSYRHIQVSLARRNLIESQNKLSAAENIKNKMLEEKQKNILHRNTLIQTKSHWQDEVQQINLYLSGQDLRIAQQNESLKKIGKEVESYREILLKAQTEAKIIEKLKEKKKAEFIKAYNEAENKELDEVSTLKFARTEK
jgi:flagellar FliJ protein